MVQALRNAGRPRLALLLLLTVTLATGCSAVSRDAAPNSMNVVKSLTQGASPSTMGPTSTQVLIYSPVSLGGSLQPGLTVSGTYGATCQGSLALVRADSLRCFLTGSASLPDGSNVLDPCFAASADVAYCTESPISKSVVRVDLAASVEGADSDPASPTANAPWAVELVDGQVCTSLTGATGVLDGQRENYGCTAGNLYGDPDRTTSVWTIFYAANGATTQTEVGVVRAWF